VTNQTGTVVEEMGYLPFGATLFKNNANGSTWESVYRFTGQEFDEESQLYNYNARLYDPIMCRFISPDPIVPHPYNPQSLNRYAYVLNNPLRYTDPSGHEYTLDEIVVSAKRIELMDFIPENAIWNENNGDMPPWVERIMIEFQMHAARAGSGGGLSQNYSDSDAEKIREVQGNTNDPQHKAADSALRLAAIQIKPKHRSHLEYFGYVYKNGFFSKLFGADEYDFTYPQPLGDGRGWPDYARNKPSLTVAVYHDHYFPNEPWNEYFSGNDLNYATEMEIGIYMVSPSGVMKYWHPNNPSVVEIIGKFP
jgi:RHS repeat-associated protein